MKYQSFYSAVAMVTPDMEHEDQVEGSSVTNSVLDLCSSIKKMSSKLKEINSKFSEIFEMCQKRLWGIFMSSFTLLMYFITNIYHCTELTWFHSIDY